MAYTTINKSSDHFNNLTYTGDASATQAQTGLNFSPNLVLIKNRDGSAEFSQIFDTIRGVTNVMSTGNNSTPADEATTLKSFDSNGFTVGNSGTVGGSKNYTSWNWKGGTTATNTDGSTTTSVSANSTAGFSIVSYTGTGSVATLGHGLSTAPSTVWVRRLNVSDWVVGSNGLASWNYVLNLNSTSNAADQVNQFNGTAPTTSLVTLGNEIQINQSGIGFIMYCFSDIAGFSKSGSYVANGNADGPFVYTGFKPNLIMMKEQAGGQGWCMKTASQNNVVDGNVNNYFLQANQDNIENTSTDSSFGIDMLSNGFKIRNTDGIMNNNGATYWFMAFADAPLVGSNNVPATAR